jgi:hypothetical protein
MISGVTLQMHFVDDVEVKRKNFELGDVITITVTTPRGDTEIDLFVSKSFDKHLTVSEVAHESA